MGSGSSAVKPFRHNSARSGSGGSQKSRFQSDADPDFQHPFRNKFPGEITDLEEEAIDLVEGGRNVKEIDHSKSRRHQRIEETAAANSYPTGRRQDSQQNPFEIETEAEYPLPITHEDPFRSSRSRGEGRGGGGVKSQTRRMGTESKSLPAPTATPAMTWNHRQSFPSDVTGLSKATKKISRSRLSYEDSCDEGMEAASMVDPKILTSQALSEIDHLLSSEAEKRDKADAFLVNLSRKRGQSVANSIEPRHVSRCFLSFFYRSPSGLLAYCCK